MCTVIHHFHVHQCVRRGEVGYLELDETQTPTLSGARTGITGFLLQPFRRRAFNDFFLTKLKAELNMCSYAVYVLPMQ